MRVPQLGWISLAASALTMAYLIVPPQPAAPALAWVGPDADVDTAVLTTSSIEPQDKIVIEASLDERAILQDDFSALANMPVFAAPPRHDSSAAAPAAPAAADAKPPKQDFSYLADYAFSETLPTTKPADTVLQSLKDIPVGTPVEEIRRAADAFGLDFGFMKAVAKIESDFDPKQRTGSYIGLYQLSHYEFDRYGSGDITNPRDNAIAAAYKFSTEAILFELATHKKPTLADLYLIHQQGTQGAAEHVSHPERVAWQSMCATDEGRVKGEKWCKRAIWKNTLPAVKEVWKSVDRLTSGAFVAMWGQRMALFYSRYSQAMADK